MIDPALNHATDHAHRIGAHPWVCPPRCIRAGLLAALLVMSASLTGCGGGTDDESGNSGSQSAQPASTITDEALVAALDAAEQYISQMEFEKALVIAEELIRKAPGLMDGYEMAGRTHMAMAVTAREQGMEEAAKESFLRSHEMYARATEQQPRHDGLHIAAGHVALSAGRADAALEHYRAAASIDPTNPGPPLFMAQVQLSRGELDNAADSIERVLHLDPDEPIAWATLATIQLERGQFEDAIETIRQARELAPRELSLRVVHARLLRRSGNARQAAGMLASLDPETRADRGVTSEMALSYATSGDHTAAARAWMHRVDLHPLDWDAMVRAAGAWLDAGDRVRAQQWLSRARHLAPRAEAVLALHERLNEDHSDS